MKLITFAVPCYNSAPYMSKCIDSLLACGTEEELDIIIIDDGSTDDTGRIADEYAARYPDTVRAIHQPNGGHGEGVNQGIRNARGFYFKVVDSDDWLDVPSGRTLLQSMREQMSCDSPVDLFICNYVYEHVSDNTQQVMAYGNVFPQGRVIGWGDTGRFGLTQYLLMHCLYYKTSVLRESGVVLPKHTFYVDNLIAYVPLPYVKTLCYLNLDLYRYFIGRGDQSVTEANMIKRIDQQLLVNRTMIEAHSEERIRSLDKMLQRYLRNYMRVVIAISSIFALLAGTEEGRQKKAGIWNYLKEKHPGWYRRLKYRSPLLLINLPGRIGRKIAVYSYRVTQRNVKFN